MAKNTHLHAVGISAVERQLAVAGVAARGADHIARYGNRRAIGNEVEGGSGVAGSQVECSEIAVAINGDCSGRGGLKSSRSLSRESICILPITQRCGRVAQLEIRASDCTQRLAAYGRSGVDDILG